MTNFYEQINTVKKRYSDASAALAKKFGLSVVEFDVIMFLADHSEKDTATDISESRHIAKSHVSMAVHSLCRRGMLARKTELCNRRTVHLKLKGSCDELIAKGHEMQKEFAAAILKGLSDTDIKSLKSFLKIISQNAQKIQIAAEV